MPRTNWVTRSPRKIRSRREPYWAATVESGRVSRVKTTPAVARQVVAMVNRNATDLVDTARHDEAAGLQDFVGNLAVNPV